MRCTIDGAGRLVIPKAMRDRLGLGPGGAVEVELTSDGVLVTPADLGTAVIERVDGFPVVRTGGNPISSDALLALRDADRR
jgi:AbrB family looped-hinge helix DNA binding protein